MDTNEIDRLLRNLNPDEGRLKSILNMRINDPSLKRIEDVGIDPSEVLGLGQLKNRAYEPRLREQNPIPPRASVPEYNPIPPRDPFG